VHNNGDRAGAVTLGAFGVLEEEEAGDGDGVWLLLMEEDIKDPGKLRCGMVCLIRVVWHPPFSTPALTAEHDRQRKVPSLDILRHPLSLLDLIACPLGHCRASEQSTSPSSSPNSISRYPHQEGACAISYYLGYGRETQSPVVGYSHLRPP
jgi:hypothetical protein